jgi:hypothetical protein
LRRSMTTPVLRPVLSTMNCMPLTPSPPACHAACDLCWARARITPAVSSRCEHREPRLLERVVGRGHRCALKRSPSGPWDEARGTRGRRAASYRPR